MDRRTALARLAASGAALAGAQLLTTVAFADGGTVSCQPSFGSSPVPTSVAHALNSGRTTLNVSVTGLGSHTCPGPCSGGPASPTVQYRWDVTPGTGSTDLRVHNGGTVITSVWGTISSVTIRRTSGLAFATSTFSVKVTVRWLCRGRRSAAWKCREYNKTITYTVSTTPAVGGAWTLAGSASLCEPPNPLTNP